MFLCVITNDFWLAYTACFIIGVGSGAGNITSLGLVGKWFAVSHRGRALGIMNSGSGLGMVFSGFIVPDFYGWECRRMANELGTPSSLRSIHFSLESIFSYR